MNPIYWWILDYYSVNWMIPFQGCAGTNWLDRANNLEIPEKRNNTIWTSIFRRWRQEKYHAKRKFVGLLKRISSTVIAFCYCLCVFRIWTIYLMNYKTGSGIAAELDIQRVRRRLVDAGRRNVIHRRSGRDQSKRVPVVQWHPQQQEQSGHVCTMAPAPQRNRGHVVGR